ncbi:hypothetical protein SLEP1_g16659 [Rubroshorea leprosula]|uniref:Reverse transcriptase zinc-binding domain-containing protein n=1 Tax=Rubroshorea leprosula TaxID=152421 RepID=A0AAV5IRJ6_9ROSI|nr:hypothetical protein SLEP1_g16659 [Rubroshorea leprosula]
MRFRKYVGDYWKWRYDVEGRLVPSKVSIFGWRLCLDRLPTRRNLQKRGVTFQEDNTTCGLCKKGVEEVDHLFCTCMEAWVVWAKMIKWWGMELVMPDTVKGVAETFIYGLGSLVGKEMGAYIFLVTACRPAIIVSSPSAAEECLSKNDIIFASHPRLMIGEHMSDNCKSLVWYSRQARSFKNSAFGVNAQCDDEDDSSKVILWQEHSGCGRGE